MDRSYGYMGYAFYMQHNLIFYQKGILCAKCRINKMWSWIFLSNAQDIDCVLVRQKESWFRLVLKRVRDKHLGISYSLTVVHLASSCGHYDWKNPFKWSYSFQQQQPTSSVRKKALNHKEFGNVANFGIKSCLLKCCFIVLTLYA